MVLENFAEGQFNVRIYNPANFKIHFKYKNARIGG